MASEKREKTYQLVISIKDWHLYVLTCVLAIIIIGGVSGCYQGRTISRITGRATYIDLPDDVTSYDQVLSISFHKNADGETLKDVTYMGPDGKLHSKEYNDWGIFQGEIIWNLQGGE